MRVIALEAGYDNITIRNPGEEFEMPEEVFARRPRLNAIGEEIPGAYYEPPHWFEPVDAAEKAKVDAERKAVRKLNLAVPAIDPGKQLADLQAANKLLVEELEAARKAAIKPK